MMEMPPLPKPHIYELERDVLEYHTEDQLREYGESCARMAREEAAKLCENVAANYTKQYELGAKECAAAIRKG